MEILVFDKESEENDIYDIVSKHLNIKFIKVKTKKDFFYKFEELSSDSILIIDVTNEIGEKIFQYITNTTPKQKILVLSKTLTYNHTFTCEECSNLFNRKLLLKPLNPKKLILYIQNFDKHLCKYSSNSNEIVEIMDEILKQFIFYKYDKDKKMILKNHTTSADIRELIAITELLKLHNIRYVIENQDIKLYF